MLLGKTMVLKGQKLGIDLIMFDMPKFDVILVTPIGMSNVIFIFCLYVYYHLNNWICINLMAHNYVERLHTCVCYEKW